MNELASGLSRLPKLRARPAQAGVSRPPGDALGQVAIATVRPCLSTVVRLTHLRRERRPPPEIIHKHLREQLAVATKRLSSLGIQPEDVTHIQYALAAFIDEFMLVDPGPLRDFWQSQLFQLEMFGENRAGEGFYERLERARADQRLTVLRIYHLCLLFGFQGIYGQHGALAREEVIERVSAMLAAGEDTAWLLSPHGARPHEPGIDRTRNRLLQWLAVAAGCMAFIWYIGLVFTVDAQEQNLTDTLMDTYRDLLVVSPNRGE